MAFIDDLYVFVENEQYTGDMEVSSHSVEKGIPTTDTVMQKPREISLTGSIVDYAVGEKEIKAATVLAQIEAKKNAGALVKYNGRRADNSMQIVNFSTGHNNSITGGATFEMTLQQCNIVTNAYVDPTVQDSSVKDGGNQQTDKGENTEVWYTVKKGDTIAGLVAEPNAPYKNLKREGAASGYWGACNWVKDKNPKAWSNPNNWATLQVGAKILVGTR